jgi:hypothetical protein
MNQALEKLLKPKGEANLVENFLRPRPSDTTVQKKAGRPSVPKKLKSKNFTLCLAPQYLDFLDKMVVRDSKIKGRGRKIRFIIERFIEHEKRSLSQVKVLKEALIQVQQVLQSFGSRVKKNEKLELTAKEKTSISKSVDHVYLLMRILNYSPKTLQKLLPREYWEILSFCMDWKNNNRGVIL